MHKVYSQKEGKMYVRDALKTETISKCLFPDYLVYSILPLTQGKFDSVSVHVHLQSECFFDHFFPFQGCLRECVLVPLDRLVR